MFFKSFFYSLFMNYTLFTFFKISFSNNSRKKIHSINLLFRGILLVLFFGFYFLNTTFKDIYCALLIILESIFILDVIYKYFLNLKLFYIEESNGTEEYFSFSFSLRSLFCILYLYFAIDYLIKSYTSNLAFLSFMKNFLFNFVLEGLFLSILASVVFVVIQQLINYKNNFIVYQNLSYALKSSYKIINNIDYQCRIKTKEIPLYNLQFYTIKNEPSTLQILLKDYLKKELDYIVENKNFFISRFSKLELEQIIITINIIISNEQYNNQLENNIILSNQIYKVLEDLRTLKKNPIKYILNNY